MQGLHSSARAFSMADSLSSQIETLAANPASMSADGQSVTERPIADLIAADKYLRSQNALDSDATMGLRYANFVPPGPLGSRRS